MKTICLDPVTPPLLIAGHLSFVTVDRPPPDGWIGQRAAIYTDPWAPLSEMVNVGGDWFTTFRPTVTAGDITVPGRWIMGNWSTDQTMPLALDAIVGSGTLAEALPICHWRDADNQTGREVNFGTGWLHPLSHEAQSWFAVHVERIAVTDRGLEHQGIGGRKGVVQDISDQLPLQDWSVGRWALRFTDVAPTGERCPECGGDGAWTSDGQRCYGCDGAGACAPVVAPVLSGAVLGGPPVVVRGRGCLTAGGPFSPGLVAPTTPFEKGGQK